ncbi:MAG: class I tRNA ligase family protein [Acidobacteriota bacterium]
MSSHKIDARRRELARQVRGTSIEAFHDQLAEAGVTRAFVVSENGEITLSHPKLLAPVRAFFELSQDFADHEGIFIGREEGIPTLFFAAVHDTRRGLGQGGLRFKPYDNMADVLVDGLRLAQGMTRKNALAGLWWGGGKGIVAATEPLRTPEYLTESTPQRLELFRAYGRFVASLGGIYYTAEDVGTKTTDMNAILGQNRFTTCIGSALGGSGNPSEATARGVFVAIQAAWRFITGDDDLTGVKVAVQGVGNVGGPLVALLDDAGARIWVTDINQPALEALQRARPRVEIVGSEEIFDLDSDIFAPCAIGAQVNARTIPRLKARLICGAANNILGEDADAERLRQRGIAYVPDYLCNRMGITNCADEWQGYLAHDVQLAAERVYPDTLRVLKHARSQMITTAAAADQLADIAATELHPLIGHRGRRIIDELIASDWHGARSGRKQREDSGDEERATVAPAFVPGADEPALRVRWERAGRFRGTGKTLAAAPISAAGRPDLSSLLSALLMDVRARSLELTAGRQPRRLVGSDPGGLSLQLAVEGSLPFDRDEIGRPRFVERCADVHRSNDAAIRDQLHQLGAGFDPDAWIDPMSHDGMRAARRLYFALEDAGLVTREKRLTYYDPTTQTVLVSPDVIRTTVEVHERFTLRFTVQGDVDETLEVDSHFPELLPGAVAIAVLADGPYGHLDGRHVDDPFDRQPLPVLAFPRLSSDARFLVPAHDRADEALANARGLDARRVTIDPHGRFLLPGEAPLVREEARRRVCEHLGDRIERTTGRFDVEAFRARGSGTLVNLGMSQQVFVHFDKAAARLRLAIENGTVRFSDEVWRRRTLELLSDPEPWCISRQYWWGHSLPGSDDEVLSVWFSLVASTLDAVGWPNDPEPEPIDELYTDSERLARWVLPCQLVSLVLTGRPAFRHIRVHGRLEFLERVLEDRPDRDEASLEGAKRFYDEERFVVRWVRRPMRPGLSNAIEPAALIRRFGADALRLGYLLSLHGGTMNLATAAESHLRRARRTVRRLSSKVTGLFHLTRDATEGGATRFADAWILDRATAASRAARRAYEELRLADAGHLLPPVVDELARYATIAAGRNRRGYDLDSIRATASAVIARLADGFSPVCPYAFEKLGAWTAARASGPRPQAGAGVDATAWASDLVEELRRRPAGEIEVGSSDPEVLSWLRRDHHELEALAGRSVTLVNELQAGSAVGPCFVHGPTE